ncbi:MAG: hypothetical protein H8D97_01745 [Proteobacteria bacterium]|nr:hypothetical protein [Pseudomonadota bacterium]
MEKNNIKRSNQQNNEPTALSIAFKQAILKAGYSSIKQYKSTLNNVVLKDN